MALQTRTWHHVMEEAVLCTESSPVVLLWENESPYSLWCDEPAGVSGSQRQEQRQEVLFLSYTYRQDPTSAGVQLLH